MPNSLASALTLSAATCAAKGVPLREPLNPQPPAVAHARVLPERSEIVTMVLLKVAWICAIPSTTLTFVFLRTFLTAIENLTSYAKRFGYLRIGLRFPLRVRALVLVL